MKNVIEERLRKLRNEMKKVGVDALVLVSTDPHQDEYVPEFWQRGKYISGFTGVSFNLTITQKKAKLWTDARQTLMAKKELKGTSYIYEIKPLVSSDLSAEIKWVSDELKGNGVAGIDAQLFAASQMDMLKKAFAVAPGLSIKYLDPNPIDRIWEKRPPLSASKLMFRDKRYEDVSAQKRVESIQNILKEKGADLHVISNLESITRILNVRGDDVIHEPMVISYLIVGRNGAFWFVNKKRLPKGYKSKLSDAVSVFDYKDFAKKLKELSNKKTVLIDPDETSQWIMNNISTSAKIINEPSPITRLKAVKTPFQIKNMLNANIRDSVAFVKTIHWLKNEIKKRTLTELEVVEKVEAFKKEQKDFVSLSFGTIVGYNENAADVHYEPSERSNKKIQAKGLVLIDCGGQYLDGTTDTTRTVAVGPVTKDMKEGYTLVLKGHLAVAMAKFPTGTRGHYLDALARQFLLQNGMNFSHSTGHGVGYFGCTHETSNIWINPLRQNRFEEFMVVSNEPGYYKEGHYGFRIENTICAKEDKELTKKSGTKFLKFEQLNVCPYEKDLIDKKLLTVPEIKWINDYHKLVLKTLSPRIGDKNILAWLKKACAPM